MTQKTKQSFLQKHKPLIFIPFALIIFAALGFNANAQNQSDYQGPPAVPCIDSTKKVMQDYSFQLNIILDGNPYPLDSAIGHDPGDCLRIVHTNDATGTVYVQANDDEQYTLEDFFNVWHKMLSPHIPLTFDGRTVKVTRMTINDYPSITYTSTPLKANEDITIFYSSLP